MACKLSICSRLYSNNGRIWFPTAAGLVAQVEKALGRIKKEMEKAARDLDFMEAARLRDNMFSLQKRLMELKN